MSILPLLASSLNRKDEIPNQDLARQIAERNDKKAIAELVDHLFEKNKNIRHDCIKVLYEIGVINPALISDYTAVFITLLKDKNNRMQWGGMTALSAITTEVPATIYALLPEILDAADRGSVITKDHAIEILILLCSDKKYANDVFLLLIGQLKTALPNQLPMYAEKSMHLADLSNKTILIQTLRNRLNDIEKESKRKRVEKVIQKLTK